MSMTDVCVLAYKMGKLALPGEGYCFWLYAEGSDNCHGFLWLYKFEFKEVLIFSSMSNNFYVFYQGH